MALVISVLAPPSADPRVSEHDPVEALAQQADDAFGRGDFDRARTALLEALAIEPDNMMLVFGLAQAERFLGDCERAVELFDRFLRSGPSDAQATAAVAKRAECTDAPPPEPDAATSSPVPPPPRPPVPTSPGPVVGSEPRRQVAGPVLVGVGSVVAGVGAALVGTAFVRARRAGSAATQDDHQDRSRSVDTLAPVGWAVLSSGVATAIAGGITWAVLRRRRGADMVWLRLPWARARSPR